MAAMKPTSLPPSLARQMRHAAPLLACLGLWAGTSFGAQAQPSTPSAPPAEPAANRPSTKTTTSQAGPGEPVVQRSVIEDEGSRIEETRVRGQLQRITVTPKVGSKTSYEILTGDGSGSEASRSTAGKRVWNVLQF